MQACVFLFFEPKLISANYVIMAFPKSFSEGTDVLKHRKQQETAGERKGMLL